MALIKCTECGSKVSTKASACPKCGCPVDIFLEVFIKKRKVKFKKTGASIAATAIFMIIFSLGIKSFEQSNADGYYENTMWGMTVEQVQKTIKGNLTLSKDNLSATEIIDDYDNVEGVEALVLYDFVENSLQKVSIYLTNSGESSYTDSRLIERYEKKFNESYEKKNEDDIGTYWKADKSNLELISLSEGLIVITYEDMTTEDE